MDLDDLIREMGWRVRFGVWRIQKWASLMRNTVCRIRPCVPGDTCVHVIGEQDKSGQYQSIPSAWFCGRCGAVQPTTTDTCPVKNCED